jgi:5,10-methylenetetrahydromethanopterin reductase
LKEPSFGISIEPSWSQGYSLKIATRAEKLGFSNLWVPDGGANSPFGDTIVTLAAIASNTRKINFGSAILNFYTRNPALIASSFLTLSDLGFSRSKTQRAILGIGLGSSDNVSKFGILSRKGMIQNLREAVESIRQLFNGEVVSIRTDTFVIENVRLSKSKGKIPIFLGTASPKGLRLAGELSDGIILTERIAPEISEKMKHVELGLAYSSGKKRGDLEIVNSIVISVSSDKKRANDVARTTCAYLVAWLDDSVATKYGIDEENKKEIASRIYKGDEKGAAKLVDQKMLDLLTVSGTPEECVEKCKEHLNQRIDQIAFCEPFGPDPEEAISIISGKIVPKL